jgi:carbon-monoxide dehydrogenase medium subunit
MLFHRTSSASDALDIKAQSGGVARFIAGGTALQLEWDESADLPPLIEVSSLGSRVAWLEQGDLHICAFARLERVRRDPLVANHAGTLTRAIGAIAAYGIRELATLGGNLAWPKGDLRPYLIAAEAVLVTPEGSVPIDQWCFRPLETLILSVRVPLAATNVNFEKVGYRSAFSPSLVALAFRRTEKHVRVAVGGGRNQAGRLRAAEDALTSNHLVGLTELTDLVLSEGLLIDDVTASASHRAEVVARIILGTGRPS